MAERPDTHLRDWHRDAEGRLHGEAHGHPRFRDGTRITTTTVLDQRRCGTMLLAQCWNTLYELTGPGGEPWFGHRAAAPRRERA